MDAEIAIVRDNGFPWHFENILVEPFRIFQFKAAHLPKDAVAGAEVQVQVHAVVQGAFSDHMHIGFFSYRKTKASEFVGGKRREAGMALNSNFSFNIPHKCTKIVIKVGEWEGKLEDGSQETRAVPCYRRRYGQSAQCVEAVRRPEVRGELAGVGTASRSVRWSRQTPGAEKHWSVIKRDLS